MYRKSQSLKTTCMVASHFAHNFSCISEIFEFSLIWKVNKFSNLSFKGLPDYWENFEMYIYVNYLKNTLNYLPWLEKFDVNCLKITLNYPPWLEKFWNLLILRTLRRLQQQWHENFYILSLGTAADTHYTFSFVSWIIAQINTSISPQWKL